MSIFGRCPSNGAHGSGGGLDLGKNIRESTTGAKMIAQVIRWCKTTSQVGVGFRFFSPWKLSFNNRLEDQKIIHGILLTSNYMTTIALFLHTLKFKGWLGPRQATVAYEGAYIITGIFYWQFLGTIAPGSEICQCRLSHRPGIVFGIFFSGGAGSSSVEGKGFLWISYM